MPKFPADWRHPEGSEALFLRLRPQAAMLAVPEPPPMAILSGQGVRLGKYSFHQESVGGSPYRM
jgi:hypothetical protein